MIILRRSIKDQVETAYDIYNERCREEDAFGTVFKEVVGSSLYDLYNRVKSDRRDEVARAALSSVIMVCTRDTTRTGTYEEHCSKIAYSFADEMERQRDGLTSPHDMLTNFRDRLKAKAAKDGYLAIEDIEAVYDDMLRVPGEGE